MTKTINRVDKMGGGGLHAIVEVTKPGNTKGGSITVLLTSCLPGLDLLVLRKLKQKLSVVIQLIPNQSNRRSTVQ